ncbi:Bud-site selection protein [Phanerochaete sordida]|uniref:Bud-site selection protein n=1 Tax=Phanerochaete sordida TaxID=48140 RepID=A0A9P3GKE5_9APHY|nr:Bud-site selection protein [Phanerochaete sordida]
MAASKGKAPMKRKRTTEEDKAARLAGKLHHCAKEVKKAAKKAKDFEIRKLVKRLKGLRAKETAPPELKELEEQLVLMKDIDHEAIANTALKTKLKKDKKLAQNEDLTTAITQELTHLVEPAKPGSNLAKVQGRLLSHKVIATEVHTVVEDMRIAAFPELKAPVAAAAEASDEESEDEAPARPAKKAKVAPAESGDESEEDSDAEGEAHSRVAVSDDEEAEDDGWESGTVQGDSDGEGEEDSSEEESDSEAAAADSEDSDEEDEDEEEPAVRKKPSSSKVAPPKASSSKQGESTFLPSLSVGYTRGDSDASDLSDAEVKRADVAVKKNRRGQRARQLIWERKYGKNANHVKKQQDAGPEKGPQARWGARDASGPRDSRKPFGRPQNSGPPRPQGHFAGPQRGPPPSRAPAGPPARKTDDKPLHPSWEAKRKLKEKQNPAFAAPQGKKIVFE